MKAAIFATLAIIALVATPANALFRANDPYECLGSLTVAYEPFSAMVDLYRRNDLNGFSQKLEKALVGVQLVMTTCLDVLPPVVTYNRNALSQCAMQVGKFLHLVEENTKRGIPSTQIFTQNISTIMSVTKECMMAYNSSKVKYLPGSITTPENGASTLELCNRECSKTISYCQNACFVAGNCGNQCEEIEKVCFDSCKDI